MKKLIILTVLLTVIVLCTALFTSCDRGCITAHKDANKDGTCDVCGYDISETQLKPKDYLQYVDKSRVDGFSEVQRLDVLSNMSLYDGTSTDLLAQYENTRADDGEIKTAFLNTETGEIVLTLTKEASDSKVSSSAEIYAPSTDSAFIVVNTLDETGEKALYKTTVYTCLGKEISSASSSKTYQAVQKHSDILYLFDGKVYMYRDGVATYLFDKGLAKLPSIDYASDDYFYVIEEGGAYVYDRELKLITAYEAPANSIMSSFFVLSDGNIFAQNIIYLPNEAEEYDLYLNGYKCNLESFVVKAKSGKTESVDLDYYVVELSNSITNPDLKNESIKYDVLANVARISMIENQTFSTSEEIVNLSDDFVLINYLAHEVLLQKDVATPIGEDRYIVEDKLGKKFLVDGKGELIGEVTDATYNEKTGIFSLDEKYYDKDLNLVIDLNGVEYELVKHCYPMDLTFMGMAYSVYRKQTGDGSYSYYAFKNGKLAPISNGGYVTMYYCDNNADNNYFYYDYSADNGKINRAYCDFDGNVLFEVDITAGSFVNITCTALGGGTCLALEHDYYSEDGQTVKDIYISVAK